MLTTHVLFQILFAANLTFAQDALPRFGSDCEKRYVIAFQNDAPAFFVDEHNKKNGMAYELLTEIARRLGCKSSEQITSYLTLRENFIRNKYDIYALTTRDPELDKVADFVEMYMIPRSMVVSKKFATNKDSIASVMKNNKVTVGNVLGGRLFMQESERAELEGKHRLRNFPGPSDAYQALIEGRIQAVFSSPVFTYHYLTRANKMHQFYSFSDPKAEGYIAGFYLSKKRLTEVERGKIREIIADMRADGTLLRVSKKYVNEEDLKYYLPLKK